MGVSRPSLREALNRLKELGLIQIEQSKGTFVKNIEPTDTFGILNKFIFFDKECVVELLEARLEVESVTAKIAAMKATVGDIIELSNNIERMEKDVDEINTEDFTERDVQFHLLVSKCSKNRIMNKIIEIIRDLIQQLIKTLLTGESKNTIAHMRRTYNYHFNIYICLLT